MNIITLNSRFALQLFSIVTVFSLLAGLVPAQVFANNDQNRNQPIKCDNGQHREGDVCVADLNPNITICHANEGVKQFTTQTVDSKGIVEDKGHDSHTNKGLDDKGDIIQSFQYNYGDGPKTYPGKNLTTAYSNGKTGTQILTNDCVVVAAPTSGTITIAKTVVNDDNGTAVAGDFTYKIDGNIVAQGTKITVSAAAHTVSEGVFTGYTASAWSGACAANGSITVVAGQDYVCSITNDDNDPVVIDLCSNIDGPQTTTAGYTVNGTICTPITVVDVCPNIDGAQATIPDGLIKNDAGNCVAPIVPVDLCSNIDGLQTVTTGYTVVGTICTAIPNPIPGCTDRTATNFNAQANTNDQSCEYNYVSQCVVATNLLQNGSFETPVVTANGGTWEIFPSVANWAISLSSGLELWRGIVIPSNGLQNVELDGDNATKITQATTTIPGATYELRVDFAARTADKADNNINMLVDGTVAKNVNSANTNWTTYGKTFVAASTSTEIGFEDIGTPQDPGGTGSLIDNAVLCLVREPIVEPVKACEVTVVSDTTNTFQSNPAALAWVHPAWMQEITGSVAKWIWGTEKVTDPSATTTQTFTKTFIWNGPLTAATLKIAADNSYSVKLNGVEFNVGDGFASADTYNMTTFLQTNIVSGVNTLEITGTNWSWSTQNPDENPAGVIYDLNIVGNTNINCKVAPTDGGDGDGGDTDGGDGTDVNEISNRRSGGNGGTRIARAPRGEVLGAASSTPVGMVLGEATSTLPVGAPNTGAGGTAPVTVSLPTLVAVLSTATRRSK